MKAILSELKPAEIDTLSFDDVLEMADVSLAEYEDALSTTQNGTLVVLKRNIKLGTW